MKRTLHRNKKGRVLGDGHLLGHYRIQPGPPAIRFALSGAVQHPLTPHGAKPRLTAVDGHTSGSAARVAPPRPLVTVQPPSTCWWFTALSMARTPRGLDAETRISNVDSQLAVPHDVLSWAFSTAQNRFKDKS